MKNITEKTKSGFSKAGSAISEVRMKVKLRHSQLHGQKFLVRVMLSQITHKLILQRSINK